MSQNVEENLNDCTLSVLRNEYFGATLRKWMNDRKILNMYVCMYLVQKINHDSL